MPAESRCLLIQDAAQKAPPKPGTPWIRERALRPPRGSAVAAPSSLIDSSPCRSTLHQIRHAAVLLRVVASPRWIGRAKRRKQLAVALRRFHSVHCSGHRFPPCAVCQDEPDPGTGAMKARRSAGKSRLCRITYLSLPGPYITLNPSTGVAWTADGDAHV